MFLPDQPEHIQHYLHFKKQLLTAMTYQDPLAILESQIFQKYQANISNLSPIPHPSRGISNQVKGCDQAKHYMDTKITTYNIDEIKVNVVQRRSHSCDLIKNGRNSSEGERLWRNRVKRLEEQQKIDLMIWSNIMNNHFRTENNYTQRQFVKIQGFEQSQNDMGKVNVDKNYKDSKGNTPVKMVSPNKRNKPEQDIPEKNELQSSTFLANSIVSNSQTQNFIQHLSIKILQNPTKVNIQLLLKELFSNIEEDNEKIIGQLNKLRKQNEKLTKNTQQKSMKELQYIVQIKHLEKKIQEKDEQINTYLNKIRQKEEQIRDRQSELNKIIRQKLREIENLQQENIRKNSIEELRQKLAIDSIRRATLCTLSKERFQIELKKEELGLPVGNSFMVGQFQEGGQETQETRCDDDQ